MYAQSQIYKIQKDMGYETTLQYTTDRPQWQIDYSRYGGQMIYIKIKNLYWKKAQKYINYESRYNQNNFPLDFVGEKEYRMLQMFREDLETRLDLPAHLIEKYHN